MYFLFLLQVDAWDLVHKQSENLRMEDQSSLQEWKEYFHPKKENKKKKI
jgi:hypothetical protein